MYVLELGGGFASSFLVYYSMDLAKSQILGRWIFGLKILFRGTKKPGTAVWIWAFVQNTETRGYMGRVFCAIYHIVI